MAQTSTFTSTYARLRLLQVNVKGALAEIGWPTAMIDNVVDNGLDSSNRWIAALHSYGFLEGKPDRWVARFWIKIDWDMHGRLAVEYPKLSVDDRWSEGINPGLLYAARGFGKILREEGLKLRPVLTMAKFLETDTESLALAQRVLHAKPPAPAPKPAGRVVSNMTDSVGDLSELTFSMELASEEED